KTFGEIGSKAFSSFDDMVLFEAIRELSILKEAPQIDKALVQQAEEKVLNLQSNISSLSEMAKIRNLHWWTVEYGLIGSINNPKIYGAGLLSSISESVNCLSDKVPKLPYSIDASLVTFDITKEQPQLFVAEDFNHLQSVLNEFSKNMAFKKGGDYSVSLAIEYSNIATCEFDSGVQVSGLFKELIKINNKGVYLKTQGPTALSINNKQLRNHGIEHHIDGFGAPIGDIINVNVNSLRQKLNQEVKLIYDSGIIVQGVLFDLVENENGDIIILSFNSCSVILNQDGLNQKKMILFDPSWGVYDLVLGTRIISAYPNAADMSSFPVEKIYFKSQTIQPKFTKSEQKLHELYSRIRHMRETNINSDDLLLIINKLINEHQDDWLLALEICELAKNKYNSIYNLAYNHLMNIKKSNSKYEKLIFDGLNLLS
ncbi:MAG: phenylalanine 4-monooxygenase, partial [Flavobacteriales bacterium]|nr:phenylalanine 4-monooxygenase [Flavobacteriales bacterium]